MVPLPEKSNAGGRECGRAQQIDSELADRFLLCRECGGTECCLDGDII